MIEKGGTARVRLGAFELSHLVFERPQAFPEHLHARPHLVMVFGGAWRDGGGTVAPGEVLFHPARFAHATRAGAGAEAVLMRVSVDMTRAFCPLYGNVARDVHLPFETLRGVPDRIREELIHFDEAAPFILESLAMQLLALGSRTAAGAASIPPVWLPAAMAYIQKMFAGPINARTIAAHVGVSPSRLAHVFRAVMGRSIAAYVRECRVRAAAAALRESATPIGDVALACGFYDQAHLSRAFKALRSMTPLQYRRSHAAAR